MKMTVQQAAAAMLRHGYGFCTEEELRVLVKVETFRLWPCLIRCGSGRMQVPAQDVSHWVQIITREGSDYVRDVSLVGDWELTKAILEGFAREPAAPVYADRRGDDFGGAFDGNSVVSDADPGL